MDEKLIQLVRHYEELYDTTNKKYTDSILKTKIWEEIGLTLNKEGLECKVRWASLRDQYRRHLKKMSKRSSGEKKIKWRFEDEMAFVLPFLRERETFSTWDDGKREIAKHWNDEFPTPKKRKSRGNAAQETNDEIPHRKKVLGKTSELPQALLLRPVDPKETTSLLSNYSTENTDTKEGEKSVDPIDLFFQSMAATVKGFSCYYQNLCKSKIFSVVSDLEMTQILEQSAATASTKPTALWPEAESALQVTLEEDASKPQISQSPQSSSSASTD